MGWNDPEAQHARMQAACDRLYSELHDPVSPLHALVGTGGVTRDGEPKVLLDLRQLVVEYLLVGAQHEHRLAEVPLLRAIVNEGGETASIAEGEIELYKREQLVHGESTVAIGDMMSLRPGAGGRPPTQLPRELIAARLDRLLARAGLTGRVKNEAMERFFAIADASGGGGGSRARVLAGRGQALIARAERAASAEAQRNRALYSQQVEQGPVPARAVALQTGSAGLLSWPPDWPGNAKRRAQHSLEIGAKTLRVAKPQEQSERKPHLELEEADEAAIVRAVAWYKPARQLLASYEAEEPLWKQLVQGGGPTADTASGVLDAYAAWSLELPWCGRHVALVAFPSAWKQARFSAGLAKGLDIIAVVLLHAVLGGLEATARWHAIDLGLRVARRPAHPVLEGGVLSGLDPLTLRQYHRHGLEVLDLLGVPRP